MKKRFGIFVYKELHAWKFVSGRGHIADREVSKYIRNRIFQETLALITRMPGVKLFNAAFPRKQDEKAFEWLLNRIERTLQPDAWKSFGLLFCDEGKEASYTKLVRRMRIFNYIPSQFGFWQGTGTSSQNIPIIRIVEDPVFKKSEQSYFIQLVDFCAYALLRRERPIPSKNRYGLDKAFSILDPIKFRDANKKDPEGIIRPRPN